jgi:hypothetical protein
MTLQGNPMILQPVPSKLRAATTYRTDSLIHLEALPKIVDYRLRDRFQFGK